MNGEDCTGHNGLGRKLSDDATFTSQWRDSTDVGDRGGTIPEA